MTNTELFDGMDKSLKYAVVYTEVVTIGSYFEKINRYGINFLVRKYSNKKKRYDGNANFFKTLSEAKNDAATLKRIVNKKFINVRIVKRK